MTSTEPSRFTGHDLIRIGIPKGPSLGTALTLLQAGQTTLETLQAVLADPAAYLNDAVHDRLAWELNSSARTEAARKRDQLQETRPYPVWGRALIEQGAFDQMDIAMQLPITRAGAVMPDAHPGYGLPIGGVLGTLNAVIPWAVGVDIGCSVHLSVFDLPYLPGTAERLDLMGVLRRQMYFGMGQPVGMKENHAVLDDPLWKDAEHIVRTLKDRAHAQIGTSGSGNHFGDFGVFSAPGQPDRLALLTHSGSRGFGAKIAAHYSKLAETLHPHLAPEARRLAWLDLGSEAGDQYWRAMTLAGRYARANHELIHARITSALGVQATLQVSNTHNLAWKETHGGETLIVHRKGATPAGAGVAGIIPGSLADSAMLVEGLGHPGSLSSASHGAGRRMGRMAAKRELATRPEEVQAYLDAHGVQVSGASLDEHPLAYKRIEEVMAEQQDLVRITGRFTPKVVRMDDGDDD